MRTSERLSGSMVSSGLTGRYLQGILRGCLLVAMCAGAAGATEVCQQGSLASYIDLDPSGGCTIGVYTFFRFSAPTPTSTGNPLLGNASDITVTPISTSTSIGFAFSAMVNGTNYFSIPNPTQSESLNYYINYSIDPAPIDPGQDISLDPPFGNVTATQQYCLSDVFANGCELGIQLQQTVTTASPDSVIVYPELVSFVDVQTDITLLASPGNPAGFDALTSIIGTSQTPEPAFLAPIGLAVLLLGAGFRRRSRRLSSRSTLS